MLTLQEKYLLDIEGNVYSFNETEILEKSIISKEQIDSLPEDIPSDESTTIIYDNENIYEIPKKIAKSHAIGGRKLSEILIKISELQIKDVSLEDLPNLAPVIYKLYEEELFSLCEQETDEDVKLYQVVGNTYLRQNNNTKTATLKNAENNKCQVNQVKQNAQKEIISSNQVKQKDNFCAKSKAENEDANLFLNIKNFRNFAKGFAGNTFGQMKSNYSKESDDVKLPGGSGDNEDKTKTTSEILEDGSNGADALKQVVDGLKDIRSEKMKFTQMGNQWSSAHHVEDDVSRTFGLNNAKYEGISNKLEYGSLAVDIISKGVDDGKFSTTDKIDIGSKVTGFAADKGMDYMAGGSTGVTGAGKAIGGLTKLAILNSSKIDDINTEKEVHDAKADVLGGLTSIAITAAVVGVCAAAGVTAFPVAAVAGLGIVAWAAGEAVTDFIKEAPYKSGETQKEIIDQNVVQDGDIGRY